MRKQLSLILILILISIASPLNAGNGSSTIIHNGEIFAVQWSPDGEMLAVQGVGGTWEVEVKE